MERVLALQTLSNNVASSNRENNNSDQSICSTESNVCSSHSIHTCQTSQQKDVGLW